MSTAEVIARVTAAALVVLTFAACAGPSDVPRAADAVSKAAAVTELPIPPATQFDPGLIVSDDSFYDSGAMSEGEIQAFLEGLDCRPKDRVPCLADYKQTTTTQAAAAPGHCVEYRGGIRERASRIVSKVAAACGVSPKTLLVLLQKEQSLLTRPSESGYLRATGYGCPDTADCDTKYFGFFNQVYNAAWQFRQYTQEPERAYQVGAVDVQFHPDAACGAAPVAIANQATANLYNYTPYQPNPAAVADPETGDGCSAFGNLNFWRLWHRWFGDPEAERYPGFLPPCSRLVGGHACLIPQATLPALPPITAPAG
ncbi:hypothetical protein [Agromyces badenianii]|uniref:hypothetical protein n=1 Tax=Agromyces badenianii TaxID=2080742 RepID=UPI000D58EFA1|nr:hypothetical protein [Agromyces badenianii]PWC03171.1 hypothetical protein DCE94_12970 [Agromyces badenianii]